MDELIAQLEQTLDEIQTMTGFIRSQARSQGIDPMAMQNPDGTYVMASVILAKSNVIPALVSAYQWQAKLSDEQRDEMRKRDAIKISNNPSITHMCSICGHVHLPRDKAERRLCDD